MSDPRISCAFAALDMNGTTVAGKGVSEATLHSVLTHVGTKFPGQDTLGELRGVAKAAPFRHRHLVPDPNLRAHETFTTPFLDAIAQGRVTAGPGASEALGDRSVLLKDDEIIAGREVAS